MNDVRDPRIDPMPGDELSKDGKTRQIERVGVYVHWVRSMGEYGSCYLATWRKWAKDAEVVTRAEKKA